jgi:hypothetical protein
VHDSEEISPVASAGTNPRTPDGDDDDLQLVEQLLTLALEAIERKVPDVRLADVLKLLEFKQRMKPQSDVRAIFWEWIERFRREAARTDEAGDDHPDCARTETKGETSP